MIVEQIEKILHKIEAGNSAEGLQEIRRLLNHPHMTDELRFEVAQSLYQYGFLDEALQLLESLHQLYPDEPEVILFLAELYAEGDQREAALDLLRGLHPQEEDDVRAVLLAADIYMSEGLYEVAELKIKEALHTSSQQQILTQALGEIYYQQENYSLALECFEKGISTHFAPDFAKVAGCLAHVGRFEEALEYYDKALEERETPDLLFGYGFVAFRLQKWESAISTFTHLKEMDPYYTSMYPFLVEAYMQTGDVEEAFSVVEEGLKYDETNARLNELKATLLIRTGEKDQAKEELLMALEKDPGDLSALEKIATLFKAEGDSGASLQYLERLTELTPGRSDLHIEKGLLYEELEEWKKAEESYRAAVQANRRDTEALNHLAFFLRDEGQTEEAYALWKESLQLNPEQEEIREMLLRHEEETDL